MRQHIVYRTENSLNGKFYYGVHSTRDLNDGYLGSGKRLRYAIKKYGRENFKRVVIGAFPTAAAAYEYERVVIEPWLGHPDCYNVRTGGRGGWHNSGNGYERYLHQCSKGGKKGADKHRKRMAEDEDYRNRVIKTFVTAAQTPEARAKAKEKYETTGYSFSGKKHTDDFKKLIGAVNSICQSGSGNSNYGNHWISNDLTQETTCYPKRLSLPPGWRLGRVMRFTSIKLAPVE